jgi:hypothetical protein
VTGSIAAGLPGWITGGFRGSDQDITDFQRRPTRERCTTFDGSSIENCPIRTGEIFDHQALAGRDQSGMATGGSMVSDLHLAGWISTDDPGTFTDQGDDPFAI